MKKLAPALLGAGYDDLAITNGMAAVVAWREMCRATDPANRQRLETELKAYCARGTYLMHSIIEALRKHA